MENVPEVPLARLVARCREVARVRGASVRPVSWLDQSGLAFSSSSQQVTQLRARGHEGRELTREADGGRRCPELSRGQFDARYAEQLNLPASSAQGSLLSSTLPVPWGTRCPRSSPALARRAALRFARRHWERASSMARSLGILSILEGMSSMPGGNATLVCHGVVPTPWIDASTTGV